MKDKFQREINYLRLSVTDLCNLKCRYCVTKEEVKVKHDDVLRIEEFAKIAKCCVNLGVTKIRLTGGEPLLRKGIVDLVQQISPLVNGNVAMTTNGLLLNKYAKELYGAGLRKLNISLDTLDAKQYRYISFGDVNEVISGIKYAFELGYLLKLNTVLQRGINDNSIDELVTFAKSVNAKLRFIELMPFEDTEEYYKQYYISADEIIRNHKMTYLYTDNTAEYYEYMGTEVGFIRPISHKFCQNCNRIRITAFGEIIPCLHTNLVYNLKDYLNNENELEKAIRLAIYAKPASHKLDAGERQKIDMVKIGG